MSEPVTSPDEPIVAENDESTDATEPEVVAAVATGVSEDGLPVVVAEAVSDDADLLIAGTTDGEVDLIVAELTDNESDVVAALVTDGDVDLLVAEATDGRTDIAGAVLTDGAWSLLVADFSEKHLALEAYTDLREAADASRLKIEGAFVLVKDENGELTIEQATDLRTRRGLRWGLVAGAVVGVFFPPSLLASLAVGGALGAGVGRLRHNRFAGEFADELAEVVEPGHSGLVMLVSDPAMVELQKALAKADKIVQKAVDKAIVDEIEAEVDAAERAESQS